MQFTVNRDTLLKPLQMVSGAIERRHTLPILSNVLLEVTEAALSLTGTDLEVELVATTDGLTVQSPGRITVPAKKSKPSLPRTPRATSEASGSSPMFW